MLDTREPPLKTHRTSSTARAARIRSLQIYKLIFGKESTLEWFRCVLQTHLLVCVDELFQLQHDLLDSAHVQPRHLHLKNGEWNALPPCLPPSAFYQFPRERWSRECCRQCRCLPPPYNHHAVPRTIHSSSTRVRLGEFSSSGTASSLFLSSSPLEFNMLSNTLSMGMCIDGKGGKAGNWLCFERRVIVRRGGLQ